MAEKLYEIENEYLKIGTRSYGGELRSIREKADNSDYLWNGDPKWWKYSSPVLFPIVGALNDNKYRYNGVEYEMPSHGFGRISEYELAEHTADSISFVLRHNEETLKMYPFKFSLHLSYQLVKNSVIVGWKVKNIGEGDMYFSIGAHPAFLCPPGGSEGEFSDCYIDFSEMEDSGVRELAPGCKLKKEKREFLKGNRLDLNYDMFKEDCRIFDDLKSDTLTIRSTKSDKSLSVKAEGFPFYGIWTPTQGGAPYICLEPWHGHADYEGFAGDLKEKEGMMRLAPNEEFDAHYTIIVGK